MPSAFDTEFQSVYVPDWVDTFAEEATYTPRNAAHAAYVLESGADWQRPLVERNQDAPVEVDAKHWDIIVRRAELTWPALKGDRISRVIGEETKTYRLVSDAVASHAEDDDSGLAFLRLHAVEVEV